MFSQRKAIPITITTIGKRLPPNKIDAKWAAASKPQALGMAAIKGRLNTYNVKDCLEAYFLYNGWTEIAVTPEHNLILKRR